MVKTASTAFLYMYIVYPVFILYTAAKLVIKLCPSLYSGEQHSEIVHYIYCHFLYML